MGSSKTIKRLAIPIAAGIFVIVAALFGVIYLQQRSEQNSMREQIGWLSNMLSRPVDINEETQARFE